MAPEGSRERDVLLFAGVAVGLAAIAALAAPSYVTDRDMYEQIGRAGALPDCSSLHCTRVLVAWVLEHLPGPSLLKWKAYAVLGSLVAAAGVAHLCGRFGVPRASRRAAVVLSAFSAGSQITLSDPHSSDPFIYALAPWMVAVLFDSRFVLAGLAGTIGVFAKEFAAAPLWIFAAYAALARDRAAALKSGWAAALASTAWLAMLLWFVLRHNYSFGGNPSSRVFEGGYIVTWVSELGVARAAGALALHLGPMAALVVASWARAPRPLRLLVLASIPAMLVLNYVQQPDRAMWNFQFALIPMAASLFDASPGWLTATFLAGYAFSNLPSDGRPAPAGTAAVFAVCVGALVVIVVKAWAAPVSQNGSKPRPVAASAVQRTDGRAVVLLTGLCATLGVLAILLAIAADVAAHRRVELGSGMNIWGYRGPVVTHRSAGDKRVAVLGGREVFGTAYQSALPRSLQEFLNNDRLRGDAGYPRTGTVTVVNLAGPYDPVLSFRQTFRDYAALDFDLVCFYVGDANPPPPAAARIAGWRRQSAIFRMTGYLPILPSMWLKMPDWSAGQAGAIESTAKPTWEEYSSALDGAITDALERGAAVLVATHPFPSDEESPRQDRVAVHLKERFGPIARFGHADLRFIVDRRQPHTVEDLSQVAFRLLKTP